MIKNERVIKIVIKTLREIDKFNSLNVDAPVVPINNEELIKQVMAEALCSRRTAIEYIQTAKTRMEQLNLERN